MAQWPSIERGRLTPVNNMHEEHAIVQAMGGQSISTMKCAKFQGLGNMAVIAIP